MRADKIQKIELQFDNAIKGVGFDFERDYKFCEKYNLAMWAVNIQIRRDLFRFYHILNKQEKLSKDMLMQRIKQVWEQFLKQRKEWLEKSRVDNGNIFPNNITIASWRKPTYAIRQLDRLDIQLLHNSFIANNNATKNSDQKRFIEYYGKLCSTFNGEEVIVFNPNVSEEILFNEFKAYISKIKSNSNNNIKEHYSQKYLCKPPKDFNNIYGESIGNKILNAKLLQYFDLKMLLQINKIKASDEFIAGKINIEIEKLKHDTKNIMNQLVKKEESEIYNSLVLQALSENT